MDHWFEYVIEVYAPEGDKIETKIVPGKGNDFPQELFNQLLVKWGGIGYEWRISTRMTRPYTEEEKKEIEQRRFTPS